MRACDRCAGGRRGWGQSGWAMVEGVRLMRILCFILCVFYFAEPTMESDRWPVVVEGRETDRWRRRSSRLRVWSVAMGGIFNKYIKIK
jgi:hypothetical protein